MGMIETGNGKHMHAYLNPNPKCLWDPKCVIALTFRVGSSTVIWFPPHIGIFTRVCGRWDFQENHKSMALRNFEVCGTRDLATCVKLP